MHAERYGPEVLMITRSADRTRSKRWRSGTRHNKRYLTASQEVCPEPKSCIVHNPRLTPPAEASRMRLTRCEQQWVDDVHAGRKHLHGDLKGNSRSMLQHRRIAGIRNRMKSRRIDDLRRRNPTHEIGIDYGNPSLATVYSGRHRAAGMEIGTATYGQLREDAAQVRMNERRLDISDRWYPRGS